jgi:ankyrin repeat protein
MLLAAISRYGYAMTLRWHLRLVLTAALLALSAPAWSTVYRCLGDDGKLKFSDQPCAEDETESEVEIEIKQPIPLATMVDPTDPSSLDRDGLQTEPESVSGYPAPVNTPVNRVAELIEATRRGEALLVKTLVGRGVDVNGTDKMGYSPLHMAGLRMGTVQVARFLVEAGADVNARSAKGYSVLARSIYNLEVVTYLIENGADVNAVDKDGGNSVLHTAVSDPVTDDGVIELLIDYDAGLEARNSRGETPLHNAVWRADDPLKTAKLLLDRGAYVNSRNQQGETPLAIARDRSRLSVRDELIKLLQGYGAD